MLRFPWGDIQIDLPVVQPDMQLEWFVGTGTIQFCRRWTELRTSSSGGLNPTVAGQEMTLTKQKSRQSALSRNLLFMPTSN
jgi:hypothetical protein